MLSHHGLILSIRKGYFTVSYSKVTIWSQLSLGKRKISFYKAIGLINTFCHFFIAIHKYNFTIQYKSNGASVDDFKVLKHAQFAKCM